MPNSLLKTFIVISAFGLANTCFADATRASNTSASKVNILKTKADHKSVKLQERTITNEAEYAEMVKDYERELAQSSRKSKTRPAASSNSSSSRANSAY